MNSLNRILKWLQFNKKRSRKSIQSEIFEIPFNKEKTISVYIPNIQNKSFTISKWYVKIGDFIQKGQIICELESNSITLEFESINSGKLVFINKSRSKLKFVDELCKIEEI